MCKYLEEISYSHQFSVWDFANPIFHWKWNCRTTSSYKQRCYSMQHVTSDHCDSEQRNRTRYNWLYATWFNLVGCWRWYWWLLSCNNWAVKKICFFFLCIIFDMLISIYQYIYIWRKLGKLCIIISIINSMMLEESEKRELPKRWVQQLSNQSYTHRMRPMVLSVIDRFAVPIVSFVWARERDRFFSESDSDKDMCLVGNQY